MKTKSILLVLMIFVAQDCVAQYINCVKRLSAVEVSPAYLTDLKKCILTKPLFENKLGSLIMSMNMVTSLNGIPGLDIYTKFYEDGELEKKILSVIEGEKTLVRNLKEYNNISSNIISSNQLKSIAGGLFLIGQDYYLQGEVLKALEALKISNDLFIRAKADDLIIAKCKYVIYELVFQLGDKSKYEELKKSEAFLIEGKINMMNFMSFLNPWMKAFNNPKGMAEEDLMAIDWLRIIMNYEGPVALDLMKPIEVPFYKNGFSNEVKKIQIERVVSTDNTPLKFPEEKGGIASSKLLLRAYNDPLIYLFYHSESVGRNSLAGDLERDFKLLSNYYWTKDYFLNSHMLEHSILSNTVSMSDLSYLSIPQLKDSLSIALKSAKPMSNHTAAIKQYLASIDLIEGDFTQSAKLLEEAINIESTINSSMPSEKKKMVLANISFLKGEYDTALKMVKEVIQKQESDKDPSVVLSYWLMSKILKSKDQIKESINYLNKATSVIDIQYQQAVSEDLRLFLAPLRASIYEGLIENYAQNKEIEEAFKYYGLYKEQGVRRLLIERQQREKAGMLNTSNRYVSMINKIGSKENSETQEIYDELYLIYWQSQQDQLKLTYLEDSLFLQEKNDYKDLQDALDEECVIVQYFMGEDNAYAFVISDEKMELIPLGESKSIRQHIQAFLLQYVFAKESNIKANYFEAFYETSSQLYKDLINPLQQTALLKAKDWIIVPDDLLYKLPFEVLVDNKQRTKSFEKLNFLSEKYTITYIGSTSLWLQKQNKSVPAHYEKSLLAIGNPLFKENYFDVELEWDEQGYIRGANLKELPHTQIEIDKIYSYFEQGKVDKYTKAQAREEVIKTANKSKSLSDYQYIHIATHGIVRESSSALSYIALTTDKNNKEDGRLQVLEIYDLDIQAELIVLSACRTGLGRLLKGEGVLGFSRALQYAGAKNLILSLWAVEDESTAIFFDLFYQKLIEEDMEINLALQSAKIEMMNQGYSPYQWGAFVLN